MRHFKRPLLITGITFLVALVVGIAVVTVIYKSTASNREKQARAEMRRGRAKRHQGQLLIMWLARKARTVFRAEIQQQQTVAIGSGRDHLFDERIAPRIHPMQIIN